jgi:hypothetical protein
MYEADQKIETLKAEKDELIKIALIKEHDYLTQRNRNIQLEHLCLELESQLRLIEKKILNKIPENS